MYLSRIVVLKTKIAAYMQIINGFLFGSICAIGFGLGFADKEDMVSDFVIGGIGMLIFFTLAFRGIRNILMTRKARRYNSIFMTDIDGEIPVDELFPRMQITRDKLLKDMEKLIGRGLLVNCAVNYEKQMKIVLFQKNKNMSQTITTIQCPKCGADMELKGGFITYCDHCGLGIKM